jgi:hypothetical protein
MAITKRLAKGSALTHTELDGNFTDLDGRVTTLESASDSDSQTLTLAGDNLTISGGNTVDLSTINSTGILNVVEDTTPQLGGNLDLNSNEITGSGGASISETLSVLTLQGGSNGIVMRSTGTGQLVLGSLGGNVVIGNSSNTVEFVNGVDVDLTNTAVNFTGATVTGLTVSQSIDSLTDVDTSTTPPGVGQVLKWDGSASKWLPANDSSGSGGITLSALSVTQASAGTAGLVYNNVTGVFTYTPPDLSGLVSSKTTQVAIGNGATAGVEAVSIGKNAGDSGDYAQAIGNNAGNSAQGVAAVAIGSQAGETSQGDKAIAIGQYAGRNNQAANSIVINATGVETNNTTVSSLVIKPIRSAAGTTIMMYDATSGEVTHSGTLGGDLDVGGNSIVSASNGAINIAPDGSGTIDLSGQVKFAEGMIEKFATTNGATGVTALDCSTGNVHYLTAPAGDITANFTNLNLTAEYTTNVTVVIDQGGTEYEITAVQIGGVAQTIVWQGNSAPTGTANGVDSFSFTILNDGGTYVVLGQMVAFGGV